jgi:hypothetical protein
MKKKKLTVAPTAAALRKRHTKSVADLFTGWLDMAEAALTSPDVSPNAPHVRLAIAAVAGIPVVCWLQSDGSVGWKIAMPINIKKSPEGKSWDVHFIDPAMATAVTATATAGGAK